MNPFVLTFLANAAILMFEITGARLVAPYFGASTDIWSAIIATVIGGMSLGYYFGGIEADKGRVDRALAGALAGAGILMLFVGAFHNGILSFFRLMGDPGFFSVSWTALAAIVTLFLAPSFLLGATYPLIVKRTLSDISQSGRQMGFLSAVGAVGSIVGSLGAGLVLLPQFGSRAVVLATGTLLIVLGLTILRTRITMIPTFAGIAILAITLGRAPDITVLADNDSAYSRIFVLEEEYAGVPVRSIRTDAFGIQCAMFRDTEGIVEDVLVVPYLETMRRVFHARFAQGDPGSTLFLGGCNFSLPRALKSDIPGLAVAVVEIDPRMTEAAERYFGFDREDDGIAVVHEDARVYMNGQTGSLRDAIFLDAFGAGPYIPFHLATKEMYIRSKEHLAPEGVVIANVIGGLAPENGKLTGAIYATMSAVFADVRVYHVGSRRDDGIQNLVFVASDAPLGLIFPGEVTEHVRALSASLASLVLTDDRAPIETLVRVAR